MKINRLQIIAIGLLMTCFFLGCKSEQMESVFSASTDKSGKPITVIANMPDSHQTNGRLVLNSEKNIEGKEIVTVKWKNDNERFYVMTEKVSTLSEFRQEQVFDDNKSSRFSGILPEGTGDSYYAYYAGNTSISDTCRINSLPYDFSNQSGVLEDSLFNNLYMYAKVYKDVENMEYDFQHLGLIIKISLSGYEGIPSSITFRGDAVSATGTFDLTANTHTTLSNQIFIGNCPEDADPNTEEYDLYLYMLPTSESEKSLQMTMITSAGKAYEGEIMTTKTLQAGFIYTGSVNMRPMDLTYVLTDETEPTQPEFGDGSLEKPYEIHTASHVKWLMRQNLDKCYKLTHSIEITTKPNNILLNTLKGIFDGGGNYITGTMSCPFFSGILPEGVVSNLHIAASFSGSVSINNVICKTVVASIVSNNQGTILNCSNNGDVTINVAGNNIYLGGIAAENSGKIISCTNWGSVYHHAASGVGGIVGYNTGYVLDCQNFGNIRNADWYAGGIVGESECNKEDNSKVTISGCINRGKVFGQPGGGIVGSFRYGHIKNCHNIGEIGDNEPGGAYATIGGIVGEFFKDSLTNCINDGALYGGTVGGIIGYLSGPTKGGISIVEDCINNGNIIGSASAGIAYSCKNAQIANCINNGEIYANGSVGGIISMGGNVISCINNGRVRGSEAGGIVGIVNGTISNCINNGIVSGISEVGGIAGKTKIKQSSDIYESYNTGTIQIMPSYNKWQKVYMGGIIGEGTVVTNCRNSGNIIGKGDAKVYMGGIAGKAISIEKCINEGYVNDETDCSLALLGEHYVGGIGGYISQISYCENKAPVKGGFAFDNNYIGGIAGYSIYGIHGSKNLLQATVKGGESGERLYMGGIVGYNFQSANMIGNCHNMAQVIGGKAGLSGNNQTFYMGGIVGFGNSINCINEGKVIGGESEGYIAVGGIAGLGSIDSCENKAEIIGGIGKGDSYTGGIVGLDGIVTFCKNYGDIKGGFSCKSDTYTGGIQGYEITEKSSNCDNYGIVWGGKADSKEAKSFTGGIAGNGSNLEECHNYNEVFGGEAYYCYTGGITGDGGGKKMTNDKNVTGGKGFYIYVGGIAGGTYAYLIESKNKGNVTVGEAYKKYLIGGIAGESSGSVCGTCCVNTGNVEGQPASETNLVGDSEYLTNCTDHK